MTVSLVVSSHELYPVYELIRKYDGKTLNEHEVMKPTNKFNYINPKIKFPDKDAEDLFVEDFKAMFDENQIEHR